MVHQGKAIISRGTEREGKWKVEPVKLRPIKDNELLIDVVASGICHTDLVIGNRDDGSGSYRPRVLGHEGSGYVKEVGASVTVAKPGDPVLLSFTYCGECRMCATGHPAYCCDFTKLNFIGSKDFAEPDAKEDATIIGNFFGQSSFSSLTIASERSIVNVKGLLKNDNELKLFAPMGCGIQTGSGTIVNIAKATPEDAVAIIGLGGVGLSSVMAAKLLACRTIIGIDRVKSRLELAKELGATHVFNTSKMPSLDELVQAVKDVTNGFGATVTVDTTGVKALIEVGIDFTGQLGQIFQVGTAEDVKSKVEIPIRDFMVSGRQYIAAIEGDAQPAKYVPRMIQWYREGRFPLEKLTKFFEAEDFGKAIHEMHTGETVKPIILWGRTDEREE